MISVPSGSAPAPPRATSTPRSRHGCGPRALRGVAIRGTSRVGPPSRRASAPREADRVVPRREPRSAGGALRIRLRQPVLREGCAASRSCGSTRCAASEPMPGGQGAPRRRRRPAPHGRRDVRTRRPRAARPTSATAPGVGEVDGPRRRRRASRPGRVPVPVDGDDPDAELPHALDRASLVPPCADKEEPSSPGDANRAGRGRRQELDHGVDIDPRRPRRASPGRSSRSSRSARALHSMSARKPARLPAPERLEWRLPLLRRRGGARSSVVAERDVGLDQHARATRGPPPRSRACASRPSLGEQRGTEVVLARELDEEVLLAGEVVEDRAPRKAGRFLEPGDSRALVAVLANARRAPSRICGRRASRCSWVTFGTAVILQNRTDVLLSQRCGGTVRSSG